MTPIQAIFLGIVQGLTEFLPISSSGHLVIIPYWFNWVIPEQEAFIFDVLVQVATLLAVFVYFWSDIWKILVGFFSGLWERKPFESHESKMGWYIILATIPAGVIGILFKSILEKAFSSPLAAAGFLLVTAGLLFLGEWLGSHKRSIEDITAFDALWMGLFQALAILPGVSRSGSTISGGMMKGLDRPSAARFSFLMSIPVMLAAGLLAGLDLIAVPNLGQMFFNFLPGFITAAIVGYLSIRWLISYLNKNRFTIFMIYCIIISAITFGIYFIRG